MRLSRLAGGLKDTEQHVYGVDENHQESNLIPEYSDHISFLIGHMVVLEYHRGSPIESD
jgi:hypothetical protein